MRLVAIPDWKYDAVLYDDCCSPHSWCNLPAGIHDRIYFHVRPTEAPAMSYHYTVYPTPQKYVGGDLACGLQTKTNERWIPAGNHVFTVTCNRKEQHSTIFTTNHILIFEVFTEGDMATQRNCNWVSATPGDDHDPTHPGDPSTDVSTEIKAFHNITTRLFHMRPK